MVWLLRDHSRDTPATETTRCKVQRDNSGQTLLEFATILPTLLFGLIDFSRAIYAKQVIANLTGEGSSMASRGTSLSDAAAAVVVAGSPLNLSVHGQVMVSSVFNNNNKIQLTGQVSQGGIGVTSLIGRVIGGTATVPQAVVLQANQTIFRSEIFVCFLEVIAEVLQEHFQK